MRISQSFVLSVAVVVIQQICYISTVNLPEDATLDTIGLAIKYGHPPTEHYAVTEDGYILTLFRLQGKGRIPIVLAHPLMDSSDTWFLRGNNSLAITLANAGYDVWLPNNRGNRYSRRHQTLDPETDAAFWNFSFHEMGYYDLPAIIDKVLNETGSRTLTAIGHSQGNTIFYVLGSERPEYNSKINVLIAFAPIAVLKYTPPVVSTLTQLTPALKTLGMIDALGTKYDFLGDNTTIGKNIHKFCSVPIIGYAVCARGVIFPLGGFDAEELEPDFFRTVISHFPAGGSSKTLFHFLQLGKQKKFAQYDYGSEANQKIYNSTEPPLYRLDRVTMPISLFTAENDGYVTPADVETLKEKLPNVVYYLVNPRKSCNHIDYMWGRNVNEYWYPYVYKILNRYNPL